MAATAARRSHRDTLVGVLLTMGAAVTLIPITTACGPAQIGDGTDATNNGDFLGGNNTPTNNGASNNGDFFLNNATNNGATNNGATNNGAANNGTANNGATNNGAATNNGTTADPCASVQCPTNAACNPTTGACACTNGTVMQGNQCVTPDPCADVQCPALARCVPATRACECVGGTVQQGDQCVTPNPGDPAFRPESEVCQRYQASNAAVVQGGFTPGADACDPGTLSQDAIDAGVERLNLFRWLAGLAPMVDDPELNRVSQLCAVIQAAAGDLNHFPGPDALCYTADGAAAAGSSNLAAGSANTATAIDQLIEDNYSTSVGHRRWMLTPSMYTTGIGYAEANTRYHNYYCQYVDFYRSGPDRITPDFVAWPNPGFVPAALVTNRWSFTSNTYSYPQSTTVTVTRLADATGLPVQTYWTGGGGGPPILVWDVQGSLDASSEYEVHLTGISLNGQPTELSWTVKPTTCR